MLLLLLYMCDMCDMLICVDILFSFTVISAYFSLVESHFGHFFWDGLHCFQLIGGLPGTDLCAAWEDVQLMVSQGWLRRAPEEQLADTEEARSSLKHAKHILAYFAGGQFTVYPVSVFFLLKKKL